MFPYMCRCMWCVCVSVCACTHEHAYVCACTSHVRVHKLVCKCAYTRMNEGPKCSRKTICSENMSPPSSLLQLCLPFVSNFVCEKLSVTLFLSSSSAVRASLSKHVSSFFFLSTDVGSLTVDQAPAHPAKQRKLSVSTLEAQTGKGERTES